MLHRVPLHFGGVSDPFANRSVAKQSMKLLSVLARYDYPVIISTKGADEIIQKDTISILKTIKNLIIQVSISAPSDRLSTIIEPYAPITSKRIKSIKLLNEEGIYTIVRLQPLFVPWIKDVVGSLVAQISESGCKHIIVEFLKISLENQSSLTARLFAPIGWDGYGFYRKHRAIRVGHEWVLPPHYKWELLQPIIETIHRYNMSYGSGDYGLNHLGDTDCCCGIDKIKGFSNWFSGNFSNVIRHNVNGYISFNEIRMHWVPDGSIKRYINSNSRLDTNNSMLSYLKQKWNSPTTINSPDSFLGVVWGGDYDNDGNCIYWKKRIF